MTCRFLSHYQPLISYLDSQEHSPPEVDELVAQNTTMSAAIAVVIAHALPRDDGSQPLRLTGSDTPLRSSIVADTEQPNLAGRPGLFGCPLYYIKKALARTARHSVEEARRLAQSALVGAYHDIIVLCPEPRVWCFPC